MARRKGMAKGMGKGYKNLPNFPKDPKVHSMSAKGQKQPQRIINLMRVPYGNTKTPLELREYQMGFGQPVGTIKEFEDVFGNENVKLNVPLTLKEKKEVTRKSKLKDSDKDGVGDVIDCRPNDRYAQDESKIFPINKEYQITAQWEKTRNGFRHVAILYRNGSEVSRTKVTYLNRTWESFEYETVMKKLLDMNKDIFTDKERDSFIDRARKGELDRINSNFKTISTIAQIGDMFANTKEEKNNWKKRMLKAGLPALDFPDDWDSLDEDEKSKRLDKVIKELQNK